MHKYRAALIMIIEINYKLKEKLCMAIDKLCISVYTVYITLYTVYTGGGD